VPPYESAISSPLQAQRLKSIAITNNKEKSFSFSNQYIFSKFNKGDIIFFGGGHYKQKNNTYRSKCYSLWCAISLNEAKQSCELFCSEESLRAESELQTKLEAAIRDSNVKLCDCSLIGSYSGNDTL